MLINKLKKIAEEFKAGNLAKADYILQMHQEHQILWQYVDFIKDRNISSINISKQGIIFEMTNGIKMIANPDDARLIPLEILNFGDFETTERRLMLSYLQPDSTVLDIGANMGWYCINLAKQVPRGRVIAFEPIPKTFNYLQQNLELNEIKNVIAYNFGLADKSGRQSFYYYPSEAGSSSLVDLHQPVDKIKVESEIYRLDDLDPAITAKIDLIKCDVEGAELLVLRGGRNTIEKTRPIIFIELLRKWSAGFGYHPNEVINFLGNLGYQCYAIESDRAIKIQEVTEATIATDFCFFHQEKHRQLMPTVNNS